MSGDGLGDAGHRQRGVALAALIGCAFLEVLGAVGHDPQVALGVVDHRDDHAAGAEVEAELHGDQHDREQDADQRHGQPDPIVEQIAERQRQNHVDTKSPLLDVRNFGDPSWPPRRIRLCRAVPQNRGNAVSAAQRCGPERRMSAIVI